MDFPVNASDSACVPVANFVHYAGSQQNYTVYNGSFYAQCTCPPTGSLTPNSTNRDFGLKRHILQTLSFLSASLLLVLGLA